MTINTLNPLYPNKDSDFASWGQLHGCAQDLLIANATKEYKGLIVVVTPDSQSAYSIKDNVNFFLGAKADTSADNSEQQVHIFPDWETLLNATRAPFPGPHKHPSATNLALFHKWHAPKRRTCCWLNL